MYNLLVKKIKRVDTHQTKKGIKTMTEREFLTAVSTSNGVAENIKEYALERIDKLNMRNQNRTSKPSSKQLENEQIKAAILEQVFVNAETVATAAEVGQKMEISTQKASSLLRQIAESGILKSFEVKVPKKGKQKGYQLA